MKFKFLTIIAVFFSILVSSCDDNALNLGAGIQPNEDKVTIGIDTFHLATKTELYDRIVSRPDSFLLGNFVDPVYGSTKSGIFAQFVLAKKDYKYMDPSIAKTEKGSAELILTMNNLYFGSITSPLHINIYELKDNFKYGETYFSDVDVNQYVDFNRNWASQFVTMFDAVSQKLNTIIRIPLNDAFVDRFFSKEDSVYKTQESFKRFFKGLYLTTDYGSATLLNISKIDILFKINNIYVNTHDTVPKPLYFPADGNEKQVLKIEHPDRKLIVNEQITYVSSPANYYSEITIPLKRINAAIKSKITKPNLVVNNATIKMNVDTLPLVSNHPYVSSLALVEKDKMESVFVERKTPADADMFLANLSKKINPKDKDKYKYYYTFNTLGKYIEKKIDEYGKHIYTKDEITLVLLPVSVKYDSNGVPTNVNPSTSVQSVGVYSGKNNNLPMTLEITYSGF